MKMLLLAVITVLFTSCGDKKDKTSDDNTYETVGKVDMDKLVTWEEIEKNRDSLIGKVITIPEPGLFVGSSSGWRRTREDEFYHTSNKSYSSFSSVIKVDEYTPLFKELIEKHNIKPGIEDTLPVMNWTLSIVRDFAKDIEFPEWTDPEGYEPLQKFEQMGPYMMGVLLDSKTSYTCSSCKYPDEDINKYKVYEKIHKIILMPIGCKFNK